LGLQEIKDIFPDELDPVEEFRLAFSRPGLRRPGRIDGHNLRGSPGGVEGEKTLVAESVQDFSLKEPSGPQPVFR